jgi:hypothetical protein
VKIRNGMLFLVAAGGFQNGYAPETLSSSPILAKKYKVNEVVVEANFGDGMFTELVKPVRSPSVHPVASLRCTLRARRSAASSTCWSRS